MLEITRSCFNVRFFLMIIYDALTLFKMYRSMNSLTVSSVCDHSSSVYLDPTSTGTVRHPATDLKYSMLCGSGGNKWIKHYCTTAALFIKKEKKICKFRILALHKNISCVHTSGCPPPPPPELWDMSQEPYVSCQQREGGQWRIS